jgi:hypothetical protein
MSIEASSSATAQSQVTSAQVAVIKKQQTQEKEVTSKLIEGASVPRSPEQSGQKLNVAA